MITIETTIKAPVTKVWKMFTKHRHITEWNFASDDWCCPTAINVFKPEGHFSWRMEAKDGSMGFDFEGIYHDIKEYELITYTIADGRKVSISFIVEGEFVKVTESFEPEDENPHDLQKAGWQAILNNFKKYVEAH